MKKGYQVQYDFEGSAHDLFIACSNMMVETIKTLYPGKSVTLAKLANFKASTVKGDFIVSVCDEENGITYEINYFGKRDITRLFWVELPDNKTTLFYHEYGEATGQWNALKMRLKLLFDRKSFDIKAKGVIGATKYHHDKLLKDKKGTK